MKDPIIGHVPYADGCEREVYHAGDSRQYVVNAAGLQVNGVWILTPEAESDLPIVVPMALR
jgi:hypothetical protein